MSCNIAQQLVKNKSTQLRKKLKTTQIFLRVPINYRDSSFHTSRTATESTQKVFGLRLICHLFCILCPHFSNRPIINAVIVSSSRLVASSTGFMPTPPIFRLASSHNSFACFLSSRQTFSANCPGWKSHISSGLRRGSVFPSFFAFRC